MSMTSAADASSQAVSAVLILSMTGKPEQFRLPGQSRVGTLRLRFGGGDDLEIGELLRSLLLAKPGPRPRGRMQRIPGSRKALSHPLGETDDVALRVREQRDLDRAGLGRRHDRAA